MSRHSKSTKDSFFFDRNTKLWHRVLNTVSGESSLLNEENKESDILHCHHRQMTMTGTVAIPVNKKKLSLCLPNLLIVNHSLCHINSENPEREYWIEEDEEILADLEDTVSPSFSPDNQISRSPDDDETQAVVW